METAKPEDHVFLLGQERPGRKPLIFVGADSVLAFEDGEDALRYCRASREAPEDVVVLRVPMREALEFAGEGGLLVEVITSGNDYPTDIIRPPGQ